MNNENNETPRVSPTQRIAAGYQESDTATATKQAQEQADRNENNGLVLLRDAYAESEK